METMEIRTIVTTAWRPARCSILVPLLSIYKQLYFTGDDLAVNFISGPRRARVPYAFCNVSIVPERRLAVGHRDSQAAHEWGTRRWKANAPDGGSSYILL